MFEMKYKGYSARIDHDDEEEFSPVGFHADDVTTLRKAFREAADEYLEVCGRSRTGVSKTLIRANQVENMPNLIPTSTQAWDRRGDTR